MYDEPTIAAMELAFIMAATNEWGGCEGFPSPDQISRLAAAIVEPAGHGDVGAKDIMDRLMAKYNVQ